MVLNLMIAVLCVGKKAGKGSMTVEMSAFDGVRFSVQSYRES
jgi:hypothetical protein